MKVRIVAVFSHGSVYENLRGAFVFISDMRQCQCLQTEEHRISVSLLQFPPEQAREIFKGGRLVALETDRTVMHQDKKDLPFVHNVISNINTRINFVCTFLCCNLYLLPPLKVTKELKS
ncbi:hypothetical protein D5086_028596 [Populus alba]|uniref:Uncharacterized protein n=1 Tax=Populus alba TaxID=43335 RepID=A0ACC4ARB1_POPAL